MGQITIEQAVFASHDKSRMRGYQLVARSPGIDEVVAQQLVRWSPAHDGAPDQTAATAGSGLSFFHVDHSRVAFGRTTTGGPEYSGRGGLQAVTTFLVARREQLGGFSNNPWAFMLLARSQGWMRFRNHTADTLPSLQVNGRWSFGQYCGGESEDTCCQELINETIGYLNAGKQVAILDCDDPHDILRQVLHQTPTENRLALSFSTGLPPSSQRPFQLQFPDNADVLVRGKLSRDGVKLLRPKLAVQSHLAWDRYE